MRRVTDRYSIGCAPWAWMGAALVLVLILAGCQDSFRRNVGGSLTHPVAVVNNERLSLEEFQNGYQLFLTRWDRFIRNNPKKKQEIKEIFLAKMIDGMLLDQEARRRGIRIEESQVEQTILKFTNPWQEEELERAARKVNLTLSDWRRILKRILTHKQLIDREVVAKIPISRREMRAYFERNRKDFILPERVKVRHIAVGSRSLYNRVVQGLRNPDNFVKMVRKYSITPDRMADGDLGYVERGVMPSEFDQVIFAMTRIGSLNPIKKPVKTQIGYHIFRLEDRKSKTILSFKSAIPMIRRILVARKQPRVYQVWLQGLRDKATIKIDKALLQAEMG